MRLVNRWALVKYDGREVPVLIEKRTSEGLVGLYPVAKLVGAHPEFPRITFQKSDILELR
jgi:hypothetical protein